MRHDNGVPRVLAALDKFRGTASAPGVVAAVARGAAEVRWTCDEAPMSDGGEGMLDVFGGPNRTTDVTGPLGRVVAAQWRLDGATAVIESARACGLTLAGGAEHNDRGGCSENKLEEATSRNANVQIPPHATRQ